MSSSTRICPSQATDPPMPMVGGATSSVICRASGSEIASSTMAKAPASAMERASSRISAALASSRPSALKEPSVLIACGVSPTWPITGTPRSARKRTVSAMRRPPSSFTAPAPVSLSTREAVAKACWGEPS